MKYSLGWCDFCDGEDGFRCVKSCPTGALVPGFDPHADKMGIAVRTGHMCAEPLLHRYGQTSLLRASLAPYNTLAECESFVTALRRAVQMLR